MRKLIFVLGALLSATTCNASDQVSGAYGRSYKVKDHPFGNVTFGSSIKIKQLSKNSARVNITLNEPTAGSSCGGGLKGIGKLVDDKITLAINDGDETCTVSIAVHNDVATVTNELNCSGFHGVGCAFDEAAIDLPKIKRQSLKGKKQP